MRYLCLLYVAEETAAAPGTPEFDEVRGANVAAPIADDQLALILDAVAGDPRLVRWPPLHLGRADLLSRLGRYNEAVEAYQAALSMEPPGAERAFISGRIWQLVATESGRNPPKSG